MAVAYFQNRPSREWRAVRQPCTESVRTSSSIADCSHLKGPMGWSLPNFDGCYISNEYPTFDCNRSRLLPEYLGLCFRRPSVWQDVARLSTGIGDRRRRVQPDQFLTHSIPLPSLSEQRRIVTKVEGLATKIEEARGLRDSADEDVAGLSVTVSAALVENDQWPMVPLKDILREDSRNGLGSRPSDSPPGLPILRISAGTSRPDGIVNEHDHKFWNYRKAMQRLTPCCPAIF